jgi:hypothetical protein
MGFEACLLWRMEHEHKVQAAQERRRREGQAGPAANRTWGGPRPLNLTLTLSGL